MAILGGGAVSYERGTPVPPQPACTRLSSFGLKVEHLWFRGLDLGFTALPGTAAHSRSMAWRVEERRIQAFITLKPRVE